MAEQQSFFRKQSMDSISSPEELNDYIKSASPSAWFILGAVVILLIGVLVWSLFGHLDTKITAGAVCENGMLTLYIPEKYEKTINAGMAVSVDDRQFVIYKVYSSLVHITSNTDPYVMHRSGLSAGDFAVNAVVQSDLPDGVYTAEITVDSVSPLSFILN